MYMISPIVAVGYIFFQQVVCFPSPSLGDNLWPLMTFLRQLIITAAVPVALNRLIECCGVNFKLFQAFIENAGVLSFA